MSQTTKELNKITGTIISVSGKLIIYALVILLLYEGATRGYEFGYEVFHTTPVANAPGMDKDVLFEEGTTISEAASLLKTRGLIKNELVFVVQSKFYDYDVIPGMYTFNTSMTSKEMLAMMNEHAKDKSEDEKDEAESENKAAEDTEE